MHLHFGLVKAETGPVILKRPIENAPQLIVDPYALPR